MYSIRNITLEKSVQEAIYDSLIDKGINMFCWNWSWTRLLIHYNIV